MAGKDLMPGAARWNDHHGIAPDDWIWLEGRTDHALGYCAMVWPDVVLFEGYVLRAPVDVERLRGWEDAGERPREHVEMAMNAYLMDDIFPDDPAVDQTRDAQTLRLAEVMVDMLKAKLIRDFPERRFCVFVLEGEDFGVTFHQV